ncbi:MAG TPA: hypothetical protein VMG38_07390 [Trebonia sp.]|nr:hypothetical protein [Trebonia sp.]
MRGAFLLLNQKWGKKDRDSRVEDEVVAAPYGTVLGLASDPALLAEWSNDYVDCHLVKSVETVRFTGVTRLGSAAEWVLSLQAGEGGQVTIIDARIDGKISLLDRFWGLSARRRKALLRQSIDRLKGIAESAARPEGPELQPADKVALLGVYAGQFGSFTTLLWQVPALGLTAQAFLMTIVLGAASPSISDGARYAASGLSIIVAFAAYRLMHDQRARAINHAELAKRVSYGLCLTRVVGGSFGIDDAVPGQGANAQNVWMTNRVIYGIWNACMLLFALADLAVIVSLLWAHSWFTGPVGG